MIVDAVVLVTCTATNCCVGVLEGKVDDDG